ncbi:unnamed protein product [Macrosiphum euphorbiae]|uniref:BTB domain-containing protein n=1 Tax=Macrosiphum euphorbiae TaxID=13131 RepID=A0AAV0XPU5_9HEMI|nr:unnamed protein product [Macrosiphum euphorbiae]
MDALHNSSSESDPKQVLTSKECEPTNFRNNSHSVRILEDLQSLRQNEVLCDIRFETDDGCTTFGHKNVLMAASPYFRAMFKTRKIGKTGNNTVNIRKLDSTVLQLLLDYIYTGEIIVTKENVQVLLPAASLLQLDFVGGVEGDGRGLCLKSVEYYDPALDTWTSVAELSEHRDKVSIGVLDGLMYAIGGYHGKYL